jgi:hypothetical protein
MSDEETVSYSTDAIWAPLPEKVGEQLLSQTVAAGFGA